MRHQVSVLSCAAIAVAAIVNASPQSEDETAPPAAEAAPRVPSIDVGDPAPALDDARWIIGEAIERFEPGEIYVIDFFVTSNPACRRTFPALSERQDLYGDVVTILGISRERPEEIAAFLDSGAEEEEVMWRDRITYRLATDPEQTIWQRYFGSADEPPIPRAFIVGRTGLIEWIGNPLTIHRPLASVVDGSWDREDFRAYWHRQQQLAGPERELAAAWGAQEWERALEIVRRMKAIDPESPRYQIQEFALLIGGVNKPEEGYKLGERLMDEYWHEPGVLNYLAWLAAAGDNVAQRDFDFALKAATRACEMMNWGEGGVLDTLARVHYERGDLESALTWQREAVKYAGSEQVAAQLAATLERYESEAADG
jgi:hypothetical protein